MPKRILITGGSGLLALNWAIARKGVDDITLGLHQRQVQLEDVTATMISDEGDGALTEVIADIAPDIIIHTAAMTNVDQCQQAPDQAMQVNRDLSARVAKAAHDQGCKLVHISTDHPFTGDEAMLDEIWDWLDENTERMREALSRPLPKPPDLLKMHKHTENTPYFGGIKNEFDP